jgi:adenylate kinase
MKSSDVFKDGEPAEDAEDPDAEAAKLKFPWHCEKGIIDNAKQLNVEFNVGRELNPVKIFVTGPPASGKSYYAKKVEEYYNIPRVAVKELTDIAFKAANAEEEEGVEVSEFEAEIKAKVEELRDAAVAKIEEDREASGFEPAEDEPEIDRLALKIRIPDDIIYKLLFNRLNENDCRNRGYVLDGFPRTYKDAQNIFLKRVP